MGGFRKCRRISRCSPPGLLNRLCRALRHNTSPPHPQAQRKMETVGFEPTTPCLQSRCSPTELRPRGRGCQQLHQSRATGHRKRDATPRCRASRVAALRLRRIKSQQDCNSMVGQGGLEPPTPRLSSVCSNQLSYWPRFCGVAQSREGCAVGARHSQKATTEHAGMAGISQTTRNLGERLPNLQAPSGTLQPGTCKAIIVLSDVTQGPRKIRQADILERR